MTWTSVLNHCRNTESICVLNVWLKNIHFLNVFPIVLTAWFRLRYWFIQRNYERCIWKILSEFEMLLIAIVYNMVTHNDDYMYMYLLSIYSGADGFQNGFLAEVWYFLFSADSKLIAMNFENFWVTREFLVLILGFHLKNVILDYSLI